MELNLQRKGKTAGWREKADKEKRERVAKAVLSGKLTIRYIDRGADPYKDNGRREQMVVNTNETWAERTLREAQEQKPRLLDIMQKAQLELKAIEEIERALSGLFSSAEEAGITSPLAPELTPPPAAKEKQPPKAKPTPGPGVRDARDPSDEEVVAAVRKMGTGTNGWVSSGPVKRELNVEDPSFGGKRLAPLVDAGVLQKKGAGAGMQYRVKETRKAPAPQQKPAEPKGEKQVGTGKAFQHPGPEALPEHLRNMPAAGKNMALKQKQKTAEGQLEVYQFTQEHSPVVVPEVTVALDIPSHRASDYLKELVEAGLIKETGEWRRARGQTAGRTAKEFSSLDYEVEVAEERPKEEEQEESGGELVSFPESPEPEPQPEPPREEDHPTLEEVRDATSKFPDTFSPGQLVMQNDEWELPLTRQRLDQLAERGLLERIEMVQGDPNTVVYNYVPPVGPGAASLIDQAMRAEEPAGGGGSLPVAGTGQQSLPAHKEAAETVRAVRRAGLEAVAVGSGHWAVKDPASKKRVLIAGTPSNPLTIETDRKKLRRAFGIKSI